ncbi:MAG TPA: mechanosensitive ion channel domain-containing protein [Micromonosporaceae bacterium]|nr:mechanosensitive ion channel domain-containing protein [Micromonosporaceae bacterium]
MSAFFLTTGAALGAAAAALVLVMVAHRAVRRLARRSVLLAALSDHAYRPFQVAAVLSAVQFAVRFTTGYAVRTPWRNALLHFLVLAVIAATAWLVASLLLVTEDIALARFHTAASDNRQVRRVKTQVIMLRRITIAVIVLLTAGAMLLTFPSVRGIGASLLASAGLAGILAGLAAQSLLSNVFAGLQLAFSDALRLDDVVVVEGEWGRIEELTLSHAVVRVWDDRRLILPTSYFTTTPFQNWTRTGAAVMGTVEFDVDWVVPVQAVRDELLRLVEGTDLWDGRACRLQVTDATGGLVRLRALVSAADSSQLWDLRCLVREHLVGWIRDEWPTALPRMRAELGAGTETSWHPVHSRRRQESDENTQLPAG